MVTDPTQIAELETRLKHGKAGNFIEAVTSALRSADGHIMLTYQAFYEEPELLYTALAYASARGATVTFAPERKSNE
jgi:hypothetical protein